MQPIRQWLETLGLARYAVAFEANDVDLDILPTLTEDDLRGLGLSLGDRKRVLRAIHQTTGLQKRTGRSESIESLTAQGERRQVTVLYCDLVGSTALSGAYDPEEYRAILSRYHETCIAAIERFEGYVAQIQGDGVLAYFGYPLAHEGEPERAIRAGLGIVDALDALARQGTEPLQARIGISSGLVVVSHILAADKSAVGETPNLAARLQTVAAANEVLIAERTRLLAGGSFEYEDRGVHVLKGIAELTRAWKVLGPSNAASRFEAATRGSLRPMVGREQEVRLMINRWEQACSGEGQAILLSGEPGIGKSRMVQAFREALGGNVERLLQFQCSPYHLNSALHPLTDHLERVIGFGRDDTTEAQLDKLERYLSQQRPGANSPSKTDCRLLANALSISCSERYGKSRSSPQRQKGDTIRLLVELVGDMATRQGRAVLFEDVHWADPTTQEVLAALIDRAEKRPLMLLVTFRPEFEPPWTWRAHVTSMSLGRLSRTQGASIVVHIAGSKPLSAETVRQIVDKTDGVPLFLEELTKAVLESSPAASERDRQSSPASPGRFDIPSTLRDSLMARLDRLIPVKEIAQIGACLGREFSHEMIRAISRMEVGQLDRALDKLVESELVFRRGPPSDAVYVFKHALVQDAAYDSLLRSRRQALHADIASVLAERFPAIRDTQPELLAHHYTAAEMPEQAIAYWKRAGELAHTRIALQEAIAHLERGLSITLTLSPSPMRDRHELELRAQLGMAWIALQGWAYPAVGEHLKPAYALENTVTPGQHSLRVLWGLWVYPLALGRTRDSLPVAEELLVEGRSSGDQQMLQAGLWAVVTTHYWLGEFEKSIQYADRILESYDLVAHRSLADALNHDPKTVALQYKAASQGLLGYPDSASATMRATLQHARARGHAFDLAWALFFAMYQLHIVQRGTEEIDRLLAEFEPLVRDQHLLAFEHLLGPFCRASRDLIRGSAKEADSAMQKLAPRLADAGLYVVVAEAHIVQAKCALLLREPDRALSIVDEVLTFINQPGGDTRYLHVEVLRVGGEALVALDRATEAEAAFRNAIDVARKQNARWWELRASVSLARFLRGLQRRNEARQALMPVYRCFNEGRDTSDLRDAAALLAELDGRDSPVRG
jgi:class 3 adenylate cyclase/tetratricopeptide (TPR) repeat protein